MATSRATRQVYADLLERYGRSVADAFLRAVDTIRSGVELQRLTAAIEAGQIEEALEALHIDPAAFNEVADRLRDAQTAAGRTTAEAMPQRTPNGTALVVRYDGRNPEAERAASSQGSRLITGLTTEARENAARFISAGLSRGANPRVVALDLVGRVSRVTGKRVGGIIGLSTPQTEYVASAREELRSADPALLKNYLDRKRRDKRFDRSVTKAIREGRPMDAEVAARAAQAYENRLLLQRGEVIGQHETFAALETSKEQAFRQAVDAGKVSASAVTKTWRHFTVRQFRDQHLAINGQKVGLMGLFVMPDGTTMRHPHDPDAPIRHTAGCRCQADYEIDFYAGLT